MSEAWQFVAVFAVGLAFVTWYSWIRMREAADEWISAWHYWQSRKVETRAKYDWWRHLFVIFAIATAITCAIGAFAYAARAKVVPTAAATGVEALPGRFRPVSV
jgi:hypothetical protein